MTGTAALPYDRAAEQVEAMVGAGTPFAQVEDAIETALAPQEQKAALWLLAWSLRRRPARPGNAQRKPGWLGPVGFRAP
jgi:hypothetical protein